MTMRYVSTRGQSAPVSFSEAALGGLAPDRGLWMPEVWPKLWTATRAPSESGYAELAASILHAFVGDEIAPAQLLKMAKRAYDPKIFSDEAIAPLRSIGENSWLLELFHGPTLAFKDFALRYMAELWDYLLEKNGERATAIVATSGDTGGAAVNALQGRKKIDLIALHPHNRITEVQRRFMTTVVASNVSNIAVKGDFDAAQAIVKSLFADQEYASRMSLSALNSINWARIAAQAAYHVSACKALGWPKEGITAVVPTGNFGDAFSGYVAKCLGAPIRKIVVASNENHILARAIRTGSYLRQPSVQTLSPAMDIQAPSNFERMLFELTGRNGQLVSDWFDLFSRNGEFEIPLDVQTPMRAFLQASDATDLQTSTTMARIFDRHQIVVCPHTATGLHAQTDLSGERGPVVYFATAHPSKFPDAVKKAIGIKPQLPPHLVEMLSKEERYDILPATVDAAKRYIGERHSIFA